MTGWTISRQVCLMRYPAGPLQPENLAIREIPVSPLHESELLIRNTWLSVDPSVRLRMTDGATSYMECFELGGPLDGFAIGEVVESRDHDWPVGTWVRHHAGWRDLSTVSTKQTGWLGPARLEQISGVLERDYLGVLGPTGLTAWAGLRRVAAAQRGETLFVSGAAGAVGSLVVQLGKRLGCRVIGSAGSSNKVKRLTEDLGADAAFCYRDGDVKELLREFAPEGLDVYWDNVGGSHLEAALELMNPRGRVVLCGAISGYQTQPEGPRNLFLATAKGLTLRGFLTRMFMDDLDEFVAEIAPLKRDGLIRLEETVYEGIASAPVALSNLFTGTNTGKTLIRV